MNSSPIRRQNVHNVTFVQSKKSLPFECKLSTSWGQLSFLKHFVSDINQKYFFITFKRASFILNLYSSVFNNVALKNLNQLVNRNSPKTFYLILNYTFFHVIFIISYHTYHIITYHTASVSLCDLWKHVKNICLTIKIKWRRIFFRYIQMPLFQSFLSTCRTVPRHFCRQQDTIRRSGIN